MKRIKSGLEGSLKKQYNGVARFCPQPPGAYLVRGKPRPRHDLVNRKVDMQPLPKNKSIE